MTAMLVDKIVPSTEAAEAVVTCDAELMRSVLARVGDKWSVVVICELGRGARRFNELRRLARPITQRMLSTTLRGLERDGVVTRTVHPTVPPQVEYALAPAGQTLLTIVQDLAGWTEQNLDGIRASRAAYDRRREDSAGAEL
ncbi:helix-turn-helix domain-containing protein [Micromonospora sp. NPDC049559]|uniref:winged helix-turn-helix transcriptional regulator n=1 Tax=Micromonospora sp. NPDC049559 TaxID=3155923 RepID=UPI003434CA6E